MRIRLAIALAFSVCAASCWNFNFSLQRRHELMGRPKPRPVDATERPFWAHRPEDEGLSGLPSTDVHSTVRDGLRIHVRLGLPEFKLLANPAVVRLEFPIGHAGQPAGLPELAALAVVDASDHVGDRPSLRRRIASLGGELTMEVAARWTRFTARVPASNWQAALTEIATQARRQPVTHEQFQELQDELVQTFLERWTSDAALGYAAQWQRHGDRPRDAIVGAILDRFAAETALFQRRYYRPEGATVALWIPAVHDADAVVADVGRAMQGFPDKPLPPESEEEAATPSRPPQPQGIRWIPADRQDCRVALILPAVPGDPAWQLLLDSFSSGGLGGRFGAALSDQLGRELVLTPREIGDDERRHVVLLTTTPATAIAKIYDAANTAWQSLGRVPPVTDEFTHAKDRVRLRLFQRQDEAEAWLSAATRLARDARSGGPVQDLRRLARLEHARGPGKEWLALRPAMVVFGSKPPAAIAPLVETVTLTTPDVRRVAKPELEDRKEADHYLELAQQALGGKQVFQRLQRFELRETWHGSDGITVEAITSSTPPDQLHRVLNVLGTRIEIRVDGLTGTEAIGDDLRELSAGDAQAIRAEPARHPLRLVANWTQKKILFRYLGMRKRGGREVALLERIDNSKARLRITIEKRSGLIRTVETIQRRPDVGAVRILDAYDDYRQAAGFRVPWHRLTKIGNDAKGTDSVVTSFDPR